MPAPDSKRRWFHLSPDRFVLGLLLVIGLLWLSDRFQWFGINHHKGCTVLIAVAAVGVATILMVLWWATGLMFGWRFQFGIRSLLVFCLACSIAVSWLAVERERARRQAETVEWIQKSGGWVNYDRDADADGDEVANPEPLRPAWLRDMLGDDFFTTVVGANCKSTTITDAGLEHLQGVTQLRELYLNGTAITGAGLEHLNGLTQLEQLWLSDTKITDAGLEHLKGLTQLQQLSLHCTKVTDTGLEHIKEMTQLQVLDLSQTKITDAGLEHLQGLAQLRVLYLNGTTITDAGLEHLQQLTQLRELDLHGTNITDAGLEHFKGLIQLQQLILYETRVTEPSVERLQHALPNCKIRR